MRKKFSRSISFMLVFALVLTNLFSFGMVNVAKAAGPFQSLIISQYIETNSGSTPKGIELWNTSGTDIDFSSTSLRILQGTNGAVPSEKVVVNNGTLASGGVMVIGTSDIGSYLTDQGLTDVLYVDYGFAFNGDDALQIELDGIIADTFGEPENDPGSSWSGNDVETRNSNIGIKEEITDGDTDGWTDPSQRFETVTTDNTLTGFGIAPGEIGEEQDFKIEHNSITSSNGYGRIPISFGLTYDGSTVSQSVYSSVYYKHSDDTSFNFIDADKGDGTYGVIIPVSEASEDIEYYIEAEYEGEIAREPNTGTHTITVNVKDYSDKDQLLTHIGNFAASDGQGGAGVAEIVKYDKVTKKAFVVNGSDTNISIDIIDLTGLQKDSTTAAELTTSDSIKISDLPDLGSFAVGDITCIDIHPSGEYFAVSLPGADKTKTGKVAFFNIDDTYSYEGSVDVGYLPDNLAFTPDGNTLLVANEGEPNDDYSVDPAGSVSVIDVSGGADSITQGSVTDVGFDSVSVDENIIIKDGATKSEDFEPEYIAVDENSLYAYVSLQENNAVAKLDIDNKQFINITGLGFKDWSVSALDGSNKDDEINIQPWPLLGMYMPDGIDISKINGTNYIFTANEGDGREYGDYENELEVGDIADDGNLALDAENYAGYNQEELDAIVGELGKKSNLGKLNVHSELGLNTEDKYEALYTFGGRSFSIYDVSDFSQVYDSGSEFEEITAQRYPDEFNTTNDEIAFDNRSDNKGPEPEDVKVGKVGDRYYAFIGLERMGGVMVYDVTDPENAEFVQYMNTRDYSADVAGDCGPEGIKFVEREDSPIDQPLLLVANEVSGTLSVFQVKDESELVLDIDNARSKDEGEEVTVEGYITCTDGGKVFIQDESAGINLYNQADETSFREGDFVRVTGSITAYKGLEEIENYTVTVVESKYRIPAPEVITTFPADWEEYESELILVKSATIDTLDTSGTTIISDDSGNTIGIYKIPIQDGVKEGDKVDILGVIDCYSNTYQLLVRKAEDVTLSVSEDYMTLTEARYQSEGTSVTVRGIVTHAESDTLIYIQDGTAGIKIDTYDMNVGLSGFNVGDLVKATGKIDFYNKELEVSVENTSDISLVGTGFTLPEAKAIEIDDLAYYQGQLIELPNAEITSIGDYSIYVKDVNENEIDVYHAKADNFDVSDYEVGDWYKIIGIAAMYNDEQVKLRDGADIIEQAAPQDPTAMLPIIYNTKPANTSSIYGDDIEISAQIEKTVDYIDTESIKLYLDEDLLTHEENNLTVTADVYGLEYGDHDVKLEVADINGQKSTKEWYFTVEDPNAEYNFYFGIPHAHTSYSDGKGTPEEAFEHARNNGLDWMFVTDHSNWFDGVKYEPSTSDLASNSGYDENYEFNSDTNQYEEKVGSEWYKTRKEVEGFNAEHDDFLAVRGFEMTFSDVGHINVIDSEAYVEAKSQMSSLSDFYNWVDNLSEAQEEDALAAFNHPNWPSDSFNNQAYIPELDREFSTMEVGNGAPPYSYSRSEEQFIRALDNGWHLGATNAQDNHSTNWGDPDNLTAVVSKSLSEEDIKEAIKNRRTYSTETRNLELTVKANGHWMGSVIEINPGETLDFEVVATDNEEPISKLQLMTNGGEIIDEKALGSSQTTATWNPSVTVESGAHWYVVKVIHENGKWGTASPIFTPEADSDVKFTKLEIDPEITLPGYETELKATVSNMGVRSAQNIEVKFYHDSVSEANLIATTMIDSIAAGDSEKAETNWTPSTDGEIKILAVMTEIPGVTTVTEISKTINIVPSNGKTVMIDDAHDNYDVTGGIGEFISLLRQYGYTVIINESEITEDTLDGVDVLIITQPETGADLTSAEDTAIGNWTKNGGSLFVNAKSNYSDDSTMMNSLLEAAGTNIRFNDDNVYEPTDSPYYSGGMEWSVYAYNLPETESKLNENMKAIRVFSGCSLVNSQVGPLNNDSKTGLEILLAGNDSSYNFSVGGKTGSGYEYNKTGELNGEAIPIIAKEEVGSGKLVVSGRHVFSDYEIVNDVSNTALTLKLVDYLAGYDRIKTIEEVREDYANGILEEGDTVTVKGTATVDEETFFDVIYIQDDTSGISLYGSYQDNPADVLEGTEVIATGKIKEFEGEMEIQYDDYDTSVLYVGFDEKIAPKELSTKEAMDTSYTGTLVSTMGEITEINESGSYFKIDDGSGEAYIHVDGYVGADMSSLEVGNTARVTGIASIGSAGARIRVRGNDDINQTMPESTKIVTISDIHYFAPELLINKGTAFEAYLEQDRKLISESHALLEAAVNKIKESDANIVLVPGDLTKDGEKLSHESVANFLSQLEAAGKKVYVIDGNHDINNPESFSYDGDATNSVPNISPEEFKTIYNDFGYEEAIYKDSDSLSYVVEPVDGLWIIAMDSCDYDDNNSLNHPVTAGEFNTKTLNWIKARIKDGTSKGKTVIGMMHHGIVEHYDYQDELFSEYVVKDWDSISKDFADLGLSVVFTGHYHAQDIVKNTSSLGNEIYDIETGSLVTYPCPYRTIEITANNKLNVNTHIIESIDYDTNGEEFQDYAKDYLIQGLDKLAETELIKIMSGGADLTPEQEEAILAQINAELVPGTGITIKSLVIDALAAHYEGDETLNPTIAPIIQGMLQSTEPTEHLLGAALDSIWNDPAPQDNDVVITLKDLISSGNDDNNHSHNHNHNSSSNKTDDQKAKEVKDKVKDVKEALNKDNISKADAEKAIKEANDVIDNAVETLADMTDKEQIKEVVKETKDLVKEMRKAIDKLDSTEAQASAKETLKSVKDIIEAADDDEVIKELKIETKKLAQKAVEKAGEIKVEIKVEGANAKAIVDIEAAKKQIKEAVEAANELKKELKKSIGEEKIQPVFVLDASTDEGIKKAEIQMSASIISEMQNKGVKIAKVKMNGVEIGLGSDTFGEISEEDNIGLSAERTDAPEGVDTDQGTKIIDGEPVYEFRAIINGEEVKEFKKPLELTIQLTDKVSEKDTEFMTVAWLDEKSNKWVPVGGVYKEEDNSITVKRPHFSKYTVVKAKRQYSDVKGHWAETELNSLLSKGVLDDTSKFSPNVQMTREEFVAWLVRAYGLNPKDEVIFKDVDSTNQYYKEIAAAYKTGLVKGRSETEFAPKATITRQEIATIVGRIMDQYNDIESIKNIEKYTNKFDDEEKIADWAKDGVAITQKEGIFEGYEDGTLRPESNMTKAEGAIVVYRLYHME